MRLLKLSTSVVSLHPPCPTLYSAMPNLILMLLRFPFGLFRAQAGMQAGIIALRHQVIVLQRTQKAKRPDLHRADRWLWVWLSQLWSGWRSALIIVKPQTVLNWHRKGFRWYWTWKIRHGETGRPRIARETRDLIRTMMFSFCCLIDIRRSTIFRHHAPPRL